MEDLVAVAQKFCEDVVRIPEVKDILRQLNQKFIFHCKDSPRFYLKIENSEFSAHSGDLEPDLYNVFNIETDRETVKELLTGKLRLSEAIRRGRLFSDDMSKRPYLSYLGRIIRLHGESK